jgi:alkanesulfonate monooxygenase SsuD/methylene tetrahydromethanopterin reductase-like flavin-dependent oxidoreductase (luciferase family)
MLILLHTGSAGVRHHYTIEGSGTFRDRKRFHEAVDEIRLAETLGYDCAFVSEHHFMPDDMFPSPLIASRTSPPYVENPTRQRGSAIAAA